MQELQIGRVYRHFKGDYYLVEGLAHDSESGVPCVIYRKLYGDGGLWVRPLEMFLSRVDREKYPEVRQEYRFQLQEIASVAHHKALKYAVKMDLIPFNPADKVERPKKQRYIADYYRQEELERLLEASKDHPYSLLIQTAAFYGLRRGEVVGLKWDAIDFEQGTISVKRTVTSTIIDGKYQEFEQQSAKTKSSLRALPLIGSFREYFLQVKEAQELNKQVCGNCYNHEYDGFVFVDELGERMRANYLTSAFLKFLEDHGLRRMRFHDLRHPYVKHTTKIFSLRLMDFQAQAYPDARRKTRGACQLLRVGQSRSPVRPLCNRKRFSCLPPQSKMSWILYAISMRLSGYTSTRSISSSASSVVSVSASKIALDAFLRLSCRACSSCFCFACANTAA